MGNDRVRGAARWLAERVPGQPVQECDAPRMLEARQPVGEQGEHCGFIQLRAGLAHYDGARRFDPLSRRIAALTCCSSAGEGARRSRTSGCTFDT
jgi:hypothetical protein